MTSLVFVTQKVDLDDPILGATVEKIRALATRFDEVHVLALAVGRGDLPANVRISTFGGPTRLRRGLRYLRALVPALLPRRPGALLAHMAPIYLVLAAPLAKPLRIPLLLWYTHWADTRELRLATRLCNAVLTVDRSSFPLDSPKVVPTGHGIDVAQFAVRRGRAPEGPLRLLALGRTSPTKGLDVVLTAFERALKRGLEADLEIRGASTTGAEHRYRRELEERIERAGLGDRVSLEPAISRSEVPGLLSRADALVNAHPGTLDKVVYEAAASGLPAFACSPGFDSLFSGLPIELRFESGDADDLAEKLLAFAGSTAAARSEAGQELRRRVEDGHSTETWADGVVRVVRNVRERT